MTPCLNVKRCENEEYKKITTTTAITTNTITEEDWLCVQKAKKPSPDMNGYYTVNNNLAEASAQKSVGAKFARFSRLTKF